MTKLAFKPSLETFRDDFTYRNSEKAVKRFPFPYPEDKYMYSVNMEHHNGGEPGSVFEKTFDIYEHYLSEEEEHRIVFEKAPKCCSTVLHMDLHHWDLLEPIMES